MGLIREGADDGRLQAGVHARLNGMKQRGLAGKTRVERADREPRSIQHSPDGEKVEFFLAQLVLGGAEQPSRESPGPGLRAGSWYVPGMVSMASV